MNKKNITLIGMPGVGKSTVGVVLAKKLGLAFLDSDLLIQETTGRLLHELIAEKGIAGFVELENKINASIKARGTVIATGGSAVYGEEAMLHLAQNGTVVYLSADYLTIEERLGNLAERGVVLKEGQTLKDLYEERIPLYEKYAEYTVLCENKSIREIVLETASCAEEAVREGL